MHVWTMNRFLTSALRKVGYIALVGFLLSIALSIFSNPRYLGFVALFGYYLFKGTLNVLQGIGPIYWITRDYEKSQGASIKIGFMREIDAPWRMGKGVQIALHKRSFQIGLCKKTPYKDEQEAELGILGARFMDKIGRAHV